MPTGFCKGQSAVLGTYSTSKLLLAGNHYMSSSFLPPPLKKTSAKLNFLYEHKLSNFLTNTHFILYCDGTGSVQFKVSLT